MSHRLGEKVRGLSRDIYALYFVSRHPRVSWYVRAIAALTLAYALSPIDLIPDFIPVLGHLDDVVIIPAGLALTLALIPSEVWSECQILAQKTMNRPSPGSRSLVVTVVAFWIILAVLAILSTLLVIR